MCTGLCAPVFRELSRMKRSNPMSRILAAAAWLMIAGVLGTLPSRPALAQEGPKLEAVDVQPLPGQQVQVTLRMSGPAPQPLSFTIDNPARISFDLPGATLALPARRIDVHTSGVDSILAAETKDRVRLVMNLDKLVPYDTRVDGNNIIVSLGGANNAAVSTGTTSSSVRSSAAIAAATARAI